MELFLARVAYSNLDDKKVTEAEDKVLDHLASFSLDAVEIKSLKPLGVSEAIGLDVDGESYRYYVIGLTDGKGKATARRVLIKELSAMESLQHHLRQLGERGDFGAPAGCGKRNQIGYERCTNHHRRRPRPRLNFFFAGAHSSASLPTSPLRWQAACVERGLHCGKKSATYHHGL